jgi:nitrate/nitrite-specific signal transduction histidine kinase
VLVVFFGCGRLVRRRLAMTEALRRTSVRLREQRERTAQLAVRSERARIAGDLSTSLSSSIERITSAAAAGVAAVDTDAGHTRQLLAAIEQQGRTTLQRMREVLGSWQDDPPGHPQPSLAELAVLLDRATAARTELTVHGTPRTLPAALELSGYRIVEHMLTAMPDAPGAAVAVTVRFDPAALELRVDGPSGAGAEVPLAAARERASLHGGTVDTRVSAGRLLTTARLPLVTSHV